MFHAALPVVLFGLWSVVARAESPLDAAPDANDLAVRQIFNDVFARSGYGVLPTEQSAFLVRDGKSYRCVLWPYTGGFQRQQFQGGVPVGTVAIVHTHPNCCREPSSTDRETAMKLGVPMFVLSRRGVTLVSPSDGNSELVIRGRWASGIEGPSPCALETGASPVLAGR